MERWKLNLSHGGLLPHLRGRRGYERRRAAGPGCGKLGKQFHHRTHQSRFRQFRFHGEQLCHFVSSVVPGQRCGWTARAWATSTTTASPMWRWDHQRRGCPAESRARGASRCGFSRNRPADCRHVCRRLQRRRTSRFAVETLGPDGINAGVNVLAGHRERNLHHHPVSVHRRHLHGQPDGGRFQRQRKNRRGRLRGRSMGILQTYNLGNFTSADGPMLEIPNQPNHECAGDSIGTATPIRGARWQRGGHLP